jgi:endo-1,4-beta-xylanase
MRLRSLGVAAVGVVAMLAAGSAVLAATSHDSESKPPPTTLRALAAEVGLRVGTAIIPFDLDHPDYAQIAADQFSTVTPGNEMKWQVVEPTQGVFDWSGGDRLVQFAETHGQLVRGHTLVWHNQLPNWLTQGVANGTISNDELRTLLHNHITTEVTHFKGKIWQWDVLNEFFANTFDGSPPLSDGISSGDFWVRHLCAPQPDAACAEGILADAFRWAHAADRHALLFYNDYNIASEDGTNLKSDNVYAVVKRLLAEGVPINGVGDQGHLDTQYGFPPRMPQDLQRLADLGLKVAMTEVDVRTFVKDVATQQPVSVDPSTHQPLNPQPAGTSLGPFAHAYFYDQMLKACLAVRSCISFTVWGFGDADSWVPGFFKGEGYATIYDVNLQPKRAFFAMQQDLQLAADGAPHRTGRGNQGQDS